MRRTPLVLACALAAACSSGSTSSTTSGSGTGFATQMCSKFSSCAAEPTNCQAAVAAWVLSSDCQQELLNASCADLTADPVPQSLVNCIPSCTGTMSCGGTGSSVTDATCNGDGTLTECTAGSQFIYSCDGICAAENKAYAGTCALTFQGTTSPTGCPTCWCQ